MKETDEEKLIEREEKEVSRLSAIIAPHIPDVEGNEKHSTLQEEKMRETSRIIAKIPYAEKAERDTPETTYLPPIRPLTKESSTFVRQRPAATSATRTRESGLVSALSDVELCSHVSSPLNSRPTTRYAHTPLGTSNARHFATGPTCTPAFDARQIEAPWFSNLDHVRLISLAGAAPPRSRKPRTPLPEECFFVDEQIMQHRSKKLNQKPLSLNKLGDALQPPTLAFDQQKSRHQTFFAVDDPPYWSKEVEELPEWVRESFKNTTSDLEKILDTPYDA